MATGEAGYAAQGLPASRCKRSSSSVLWSTDGVWLATSALTRLVWHSMGSPWSKQVRRPSFRRGRRLLSSWLSSVIVEGITSESSLRLRDCWAVLTASPVEVLARGPWLLGQTKAPSGEGMSQARTLQQLHLLHGFWQGTHLASARGAATNEGSFVTMCRLGVGARVHAMVPGGPCVGEK